MTENLIKRYLLEKAYEEGKEEEIMEVGEKVYQDLMFDMLISGNIELNELKFQLWLKNLKSRKALFGSYLKECGYLTHEKRVIEVSESENVCSINGIFLRGKKEKIVEQAGDSYYSRPNSSDLKGHLVINGMYANQLIYLSRSLSTGSFTIGYYGDKESLYTKRVLEYYKNLKKVLKSMSNDKFEEFEDSILGKDKIYVLSYNTKPIVETPAPVITIHSER